MVPIIKPQLTGGTDKKGRPEVVYAPMEGADGNPITRREYIVPPTIAGIYNHLGISHQAWSEYSKRPKYRETVEWAQAQIREYLEAEIITRQGNTNGLIFIYNALGRGSEESGKRGDTLTIEERRRLLEEIRKGDYGEADNGQDNGQGD